MGWRGRAGGEASSLTGVSLWAVLMAALKGFASGGEAGSPSVLPSLPSWALANLRTELGEGPGGLGRLAQEAALEVGWSGGGGGPWLLGEALGGAAFCSGEGVVPCGGCGDPSWRWRAPRET